MSLSFDDDDDDDINDDDDEENHVSDLSPANKVPIPEPAIHPQHHSYKVDRCLARNIPPNRTRCQKVLAPHCGITACFSALWIMIVVHPRVVIIVCLFVSYVSCPELHGCCFAGN